MRNKLRFTTPLKRLFYATFSLLFVTGLLWLILKYTPLAQGQVEWLPSWTMRIHGLAAMAALILLGWIIPTHILVGWNRKKNVRTGVVMIGSCTILILTGYGLYYFADESLRTITGILHWGIGSLFPLLLIGHIWSGIRSRKP